MARVFWGNYEFEMALTADRQSLPLRLQRLNAELACCWMAVADEGDRIWCPASIDEEFFTGMLALGLPEVLPIAETDDVPGENPRGDREDSALRRAPSVR